MGKVEVHDEAQKEKHERGEFGEFVVVKVITRVKFKDEFVIDMGACPDHGVNGESKTKEDRESKAGVNLKIIVAVRK